MKSKETTPNENTNSQATTAQNDEILRPNDVAKMLGLKVCSVYRMTSKREIPFYKPTAKTLLFKKSEILEWIEKHKIEMA